MGRSVKVTLRNISPVCYGNVKALSGSSSDKNKLVLVKWFLRLALALAGLLPWSSSKTRSFIGQHKHRNTTQRAQVPCSKQTSKNKISESQWKVEQKAHQTRGRLLVSLKVWKPRPKPQDWHDGSKWNNLISLYSTVCWHWCKFSPQGCHRIVKRQ